jgi:formate hydrogenlyase subunit 6/NADH:ubiquinone oxidoreductase subunit I
MRMGAMLGDIWTSLFKAPITERYPFVKRPAPAQLRGEVLWDPDKCGGCQLCVKDCPAGALELIIIDRKAKRFVMKYDINRCIYCAQCEKSCNFGCLQLSNSKWELAALDRDAYTVYYGKDENVSTALAAINKASSGVPTE